MLVLSIPLVAAGTVALSPPAPARQEQKPPQEQPAPPAQPSPAQQTSQEQAPTSTSSSSAMMAEYEGKVVEAIQLPAVPDRDRAHLLQLLTQKVGQPLNRDQVRESIRALFATGRFADIQAEAAS